MKLFTNSWYEKKGWTQTLKPLAKLFAWQVAKRRTAYQQGKYKIWQAPVPVLVVGNISVGGVGKTPLVAALCELLLEHGWRPAIVSRGYGGKATKYPYQVTSHSMARECGDEPLLLHKRTGCPVVVDPNRVSAVQYLLANTDCNLIISDDGLQHYALGRDIEIAVIDGTRGLGNERLIPAGPLREPKDRLNEVDFIIINGDGFVTEQPCWKMSLQPDQLINISNGKIIPIDALIDSSAVHAIAGIGNPQRFFESLKQLGYNVECHEFNDHHSFVAKDIWFGDDRPVIMTEKDAVKCNVFANQNCWYLKVSAKLETGFNTQLLKRLAALK